MAARLVLVHRPDGGAVGDAPEVLLADLLAGAVELEQPARPEEVDALDGGTRADHEAVPHAAGHGLRVEARRAQQPGGQQGAKLGGEGHRPARVRIRRPCQVEGLDAQRIPGQQEPALLRVPAGEGEHAAQPAHRVRPVQAKRAQHDGRVAGGLERLPLGHQAPPQVAEVVDLAVEDHDVPGHRVDHGLGAGGREVEDGEPAVGQQRAPAAGVRRGDPRALWRPGRDGPWRRSSAASAARLGSSSRPMIPAMPHIFMPTTLSSYPHDGTRCENRARTMARESALSPRAVRDVQHPRLATLFGQLRYRRPGLPAERAAGAGEQEEQYEWPPSSARSARGQLMVLASKRVPARRSWHRTVVHANWKARTSRYSAARSFTFAIASSTLGRSMANIVSGVTTA